MFPFIPLLALIGILGGGVTLCWYARLSTEEKKRADRLAVDYAISVFGKTLSQLSSSEADHVHTLTRRHFG